MLTTILHNPTEKHYQRFAKFNRLWILGSISLFDSSRTIILVIRDCFFSQCWPYNSFQWLLDQFSSSLVLYTLTFVSDFVTNWLRAGPVPDKRTLAPFFCGSTLSLSLHKTQLNKFNKTSFFITLKI